MKRTILPNVTNPASSDKSRVSIAVRCLLATLLLTSFSGCKTSVDHGSEFQGREYNKKFRNYANKKSVTPDKITLKGKVPSGMKLRIRARKFATSKPAEWFPNKCYPTSPKDPIGQVPIEYTNAESIGYFVPKYSNGEYTVTIDFSLIDDLPAKCRAKKSVHIELVTDDDEYKDWKEISRKDNSFRVALYELGFEGPHYNDRVEPGKPITVVCYKADNRYASKSKFDCARPASPGIVTRYSEAISGALTNKAEYTVNWSYPQTEKLIEPKEQPYYAMDPNFTFRDKAEISRIQNALKSQALTKAEREILTKRLQELELLIKAESSGK